MAVGKENERNGRSENTTQIIGGTYWTNKGYEWEQCVVQSNRTVKNACNRVKCVNKNRFQSADDRFFIGHFLYQRCETVCELKSRSLYFELNYFLNTLERRERGTEGETSQVKRAANERASQWNSLDSTWFFIGNSRKSDYSNIPRKITRKTRKRRCTCVEKKTMERLGTSKH